jgi:hypothetical protein
MWPDRCSFLLDAAPARRLLDKRKRPMPDIIFIFVTIVFFAAAVLYLRACERLK